MKRFVPLIALAFAAALLIICVFASQNRSPVSYEGATMVFNEPNARHDAD